MINLRNEFRDLSMEDLATLTTEAINNSPTNKSGSTPHERIFTHRARIPLLQWNDKSINSSLSEIK